jgi:hypothetical protein
MDWKELVGLDWNDLSRVQEIGSRALLELSLNGQLCELLAALPQQGALVDKCEHLRSLDKLVLFDDVPSGVRLRLHLFADRYLDLPHNHRWSYTSLMLAGGYTHFVYEPLGEGVGSRDIRTLRPLSVQRVPPGAVYTLDHAMVHSLAANASTMTLVLRGPVMKPRAIWTDKTTNETWRHEGGKADPLKQAMSKSTVERLAQAASDRLRAPELREQLLRCGT